MYCAQCGTQLLREARFCRRCGEATDQDGATERPPTGATAETLVTKRTQTASAVPTAPAGQPADAKSPSNAGVVVGIVVLVALVLWACSAMGVFSGDPDSPEPGSTADRMCDVNASESGAIRLPNGKWYDERCLDAYPWTGRLGE